MSASMTENESGSGVDMGDLKSVYEWILAQRSDIHAETVRVIDQFWAYHMQENKKREISERSVLGLRAKKGNNSDFYPIWYWNRWYRNKKGEWRPRSMSIKKGKGFGYPSRTLLKFTREFEQEIVLETEAKLKLVRKELSHLKKMEIYLRKLEKTRGERIAAIDAE